MKFTNILKNIILEDSRFTLLYDKLVDKGGKKPQEGKIPFDTLKTIIFADPTTRAPQSLLQNIETLTPEQMEIVKVGKYTQWLLKNFLKPTFEGEVEVGSPQYKKMTKEYKDRFLEDLYKVTDDLKKFERFKGQLPQESRDIAKLTPDSLFGLVKDFKLEKTKGSKQEKEEAKLSYQYPGSTVAFRGPNWTVVKIEDQSELGKNAACFFGGYHEADMGETRWCTSSPGLNYFDSHIKQGPLYVILPNNAEKLGQKTGLPQERYQWHFQSNQFMDREDRRVNIIEMLQGKLSELRDFFKPEFAKGLTKQNDKRLDINNDDSSAAGKFIQIYGYKELFDTLPDDMTQIIINNQKNNNIAFDIPESIGRFDKLQTLLLGGIVKSVPDSICNLKDLLLLSLPNNPQLTTLPVCIKDLPMLGFLNINGSNITIPEELKDVLEQEGDSQGYYYVV
ncbi:hypothetical protein UFOVP117_112 [uncultured Caudovirales phage]|uniref:Leucine-rich repeat n=1 Tax=uncultured Caudovirales phage TaxID=2100421 RepID=A0A6J5L638_9CAUD|nr:hypothetical protein UFOVP117_112 [uncultured Caudovirales phage]